MATQFSGITTTDVSRAPRVDSGRETGSMLAGE